MRLLFLLIFFLQLALLLLFLLFLWLYHLDIPLFSELLSLVLGFGGRGVEDWQLLDGFTEDYKHVDESPEKGD